MAAPYSLDLHRRVVAAIGSGLSRRAAAKRFQVSISTTIRWAARVKQTGSPAALPMGARSLLRLQPRPSGSINGLRRSRISPGVSCWRNCTGARSM